MSKNTVCNKLYPPHADLRRKFQDGAEDSSISVGKLVFLLKLPSNQLHAIMDDDSMKIMKVKVPTGSYQLAIFHDDYVQWHARYFNQKGGSHE